MKLHELAASQKPKVKFKKFGQDIEALIDLEGTEIRIKFDRKDLKGQKVSIGGNIIRKERASPKSSWWISFNIGNRGDASSAKIFAAVLDTIQDWFKKEKPDKITLAGADPKRSRIYELFIKKTINKSQWDVEKVKLFDTFGFILTKK